MVSNATGYDFHPEFERQIKYVSGEHPEIRDVLPEAAATLCFLSDDKLEFLLDRGCA